MSDWVVVVIAGFICFTVMVVAAMIFGVGEKGGKE